MNDPMLEWPNEPEEYLEEGLLFDESDLPDGHQSGFVALVGRPNVGKSTLLNTYLDQKVAIVSPKSQTTRQRLLGILTQEKSQIIFVDTPGMHDPHHKLGNYMLAEASRAISDADVLLALVDASAPPHKADRYVAQAVNRLRERPPLILGLNKLDLTQEETLASYKQDFADLFKPDALMPISAKRGDNCQTLLEELHHWLPQGPRFFPPDQVTDQQTRMIAAEMVREAALSTLYQEVPHAIAVLVDEFKARSDKLTYVAATIFVERDSQKGIVIGKKGATLKKIGQLARTEIEGLAQSKVFLDLEVKVFANWRKKNEGLARFGYILPKA